MIVTEPSPRINFCPFCGAGAITFLRGVPRCPWCRATFCVGFNRYARKPASTDREHMPSWPIGPFAYGDRVRKKSGSCWEGRIVGYYSTDLTPIGYAVESDAHRGSVQIYPAAALEAGDEAKGNDDGTKPD